MRNSSPTHKLISTTSCAWGKTVKFKNIKLPKLVTLSIVEKYPEWLIGDDAYKVEYHDESGIAKKQYKVKLKNMKKRMTVKIDDKGEFL